jgi:putative ATP-binding cassette transporter
MALIRMILARSWRTLLPALLLSGASAAVGVKVMAFVNEHMIQGPDIDRASLMEFAALLVAMFAVASAAQMLMTRLGHRLVYELRRSLVKRILDTDCERLEQVGPARILASLSSDTGHITSAFISLPNAVYGTVLTSGALGYLAWLSLPLFWAIAGWLSLAVLIGWLLLVRTHRHIEAGREVEDLLYQDYQAIINGRKELTLNRARARNVYEEEFEPHAREGRDHETRADVYNALNENWVNMMILGAIGLSFFLAQAHAWADLATATTYALTILFLRAPLTAAVSALPGLLAGGVALAKVNSLELADYEPRFAPAGERLPADWRTLQLDSVCYAYPRSGDGPGFTVGPLNLRLHRGETVFVLGGNGSGKSTLARLLAGIYLPTSGAIQLDGQRIDDRCRAAYHALFSSVYSDFHLFDQLLGPEDAPASETAVQQWLTSLRLVRKAKIEQGKLMDLKLSQGQRKRLALLLAALEERPILILDEWAADQDPSFREIFYFELLPKLKATGTTIFAITHDERYFHLADRLLKMDGGHLTEMAIPQAITAAGLRSGAASVASG